MEQLLQQLASSTADLASLEQLRKQLSQQLAPLQQDIFDAEAALHQAREVHCHSSLLGNCCICSRMLSVTAVNCVRSVSSTFQGLVPLTQGMPVSTLGHKDIPHFSSSLESSLLVLCVHV